MFLNDFNALRGTMPLAGRDLLDVRAVATYMFAMVEIAIINKTSAQSEVVEDKVTF